MWVITPSWLSGSLRPFLYSSFVYSCYIFLIYSAFVKSLPFYCACLCMKYSLSSSSFLKEISSLLHSIVLLDSTPSPPQKKEKNLKIYSHKDICIPMYRTLFIIAKTWKQPKCPLKDKWVIKVLYTYDMEFIQTYKERTFRFMQQHGWILRSLR